MRARLLEALQDSDYIETDASKPGFLVYIMGPYKSYPPYATDPDIDSDVATIRPTLDEINDRLEDEDTDLELDHDDALALLVKLKRDIRNDTGVNAFLATDPQIPLHEMDAATQSIEYTKAATATLFIAPAMGDNLGVGIETGSVCEHLDEEPLLEQVQFLEEKGVESGMVDAVSQRWHVTVGDFESYDELYKLVRSHLRIVAQGHL